MDILSEVYYKSAAENERNLRFWENYLQNLKNLDFSIFNDKLKVPILVPIGSRILFKGEIEHTNEVTVALGADYFVKCSVKQAQVLRQHRIKDAQSKVNMYNKEKEYLENQLSFTKKTVYHNQGQEIVEDYNEEKDKEWRKKHRENVRQYKQSKSKEENIQREDITDEELWNRLEELELQEELENELSNVTDNKSLNKYKESKEEAFIVKEEDYIQIKSKEVGKTDSGMKDNIKEIKPKKATFDKIKPPKQAPNLSLLQQVINKQIELEEKLTELKKREGGQSKTETDLISRLDELEQLDELEDEMDRLDDILENEDLEDEKEEENLNETHATKLQRRVSFVDEDDSETLEIFFKHSPVEPNNEPYNPNQGIQKPSDIYKAYSKFFGNGTTSILKKTNYKPISKVPEVNAPEEKVHFGIPDKGEHQTIVVKDVVENVNQGNYKLQSQARPTSLFKKKRMQNKS